MTARRGFAFAVAVAFAGIAACDSFSDADPSASGDGGADGSEATDAASLDVVVIPDAPPDGANPPTGLCEALVGLPYTTAEATVTALAADGLNVYWCSSTGATRQTTTDAGGAQEPIFRNLGTCTELALGDFVAARFATTNNLRVKSKANIADEAGIPSESSNSVGVDPRTATSFFTRRSTGVFSCTFGSSCGSVVDKNQITRIVPAPAGFDYMAANGARSGVYHCDGNCKNGDGGDLLANASDMISTKIASDETFIYFLDRSVGILRKVARTGGPAIDVMTGLIEPIDVAIDSSGRLVVATAGHGVFRGPKSGCIAPVAPTGALLGAMALSATTVWYAEGNVIKRVGP